jgi:hypothetical protein
MSQRLRELLDRENIRRIRRIPASPEHEPLYRAYLRQYA